MVQLPTVSETDTRDAFVATPIDDYELIDFGSGRKLERWGDYLVELPDRMAGGVPAEEHWNSDWIYVADVGVQGHWEPTRSGLQREWLALVDGQKVICRLDPRGYVGLLIVKILAKYRWLLLYTALPGVAPQSNAFVRVR